MKSSTFNRTYFIIDCNQDNKIIRSFAKANDESSRSLWVGKDVSKIIIKRQDTDENVNFYEISNIEDKIFNVDSFETSRGMIIYVVKEIKQPLVEVKEEKYSLNKDLKKSLDGGTKRNWKEIQERIEISKQYAIVPAYNKGPYMVVSKEDLKTAGKKV